MAELTHKSHQELRRGWKGNQNESQFENVSQNGRPQTPFRYWGSFMQNLAVLRLLQYKERNGHQIDTTPEHTKLETSVQSMLLKMKSSNLWDLILPMWNKAVCQIPIQQYVHMKLSEWNSFSFIANSPLFIEGFRVEIQISNLVRPRRPEDQHKQEDSSCHTLSAGDCYQFSKCWESLFL